MSKRPSISFAKFAPVESGTAILLVAAEGRTAAEAESVVGPALLSRIIDVSEFKGKMAAGLSTIAPAGTELERLVLVGSGDPAKLKADDWLKIGGAALSKIGTAKNVTAILALPGVEISAENVADFALGMLLRSYTFDKYKTKKGKDNSEEKEDKSAAKITIQVADPGAAKKSYAHAEAVADGVVLARDLVNEPANILGPVEFAERVEELKKLDVKVEILTEKDMKKLGMGSLLGVAQGSARPARLAIMEWHGGKGKDKPIAFVGKGVTFDSGGVSIKPAAGMDEMKGDMGGAAAVTGLMHALASRKAKVNAVGIIGLVENMINGDAQRPGDIVTSMSGQTIEVLNTDAEGRLVLADALYYCNERFNPKFMVNLATLTGAIMVALGVYHAGLFSNDDTLAGQLFEAGQATGEKLWRMPLGDEYDKLIDTKNADMKNIGGRHGGAIIAAQFLKRFVGDTPWAHLDVAGTAMGAPATEYSQSWASGFGVRLLDRLVRDHFEG
ncbi:leucyl aminopeptidase [Phyllobacterium brassicacearum]|uniref:Probable cytosol aminopeptidase n=1 Tax=Phyllobacterium brassicacearum TaxID=314235 RepID=A0A2P7BNI7_9HYPH|nr:leucyl aminopeptidase [Phyllobacterium brassicacearum]PSH68012.1 leucyl aminopeptidase [Phyllobacterium brassicacearum]TDQ28271.1 leucyl aminopeptidase [Phyllobacterium brassicacearum]